MHRKKASDFSQELLDLFDGYVHDGISRRQFLDRAQKFAVGSQAPVSPRCPRESRAQPVH
jgi:hypothetical protein